MEQFEEFSIGNCAGCPLVQSCVQEAETSKEVSEVVSRLAMGTLPEVMARKLFENFSSQFSSYIAQVTEEGNIQPFESPEDLTRMFRARAADFLEVADSAREASKTEIAELTRGCEKPLAMRAARSGKIVVATICMSPSRPSGRETEQVAVNRKSSV